MVEQELLRLRRLATRLLLLASTERPDFLNVAPIEVEPLLVDACKRWSTTPRRWSLGVLDDAIVEGDWDRLVIALDALIENAVDHTEVDGGIELSARLDGPNVVLAVADSGSGIPPEALARIFDRFARVDPHRNREGGGFGLGLAIVKAIAEAYHGSVQARSTEGLGVGVRVAPAGVGGALGAETGPPGVRARGCGRRAKGPTVETPGP